MSKWVYTFGNGKAEGDASMRNLLGGKGALQQKFVLIITIMTILIRLT